MKKLLIVIFCFVSIFCFGKVEDLYGVWKYENIEYTFEPDSMMIDEVDVEGFIYSYTLKGDTIFYHDEIDTNIVYNFVIKSLDKHEIVLRTYAEDLDSIVEFTLYRKE